MGLGILEPPADRVPGTVTIYEREAQLQAHSLDPNNTRFKHATGKHGEPILLVPQPSDDPNDPLNWPLWRRDIILGILCLLSIIATTLSPILAADSLSLSIYFEISFPDVSLLTGYHLLGVAVGGIFFIPSARIWGKRHAYLLGCIILIFSSAWGGASRYSHRSLLGSRIVQGIGLAPFEALVSVTVGDMYHVHERGKRMALATISLFGSAFFTPVIVGVIAHNIGWWWSFYLVAIFSAAMFPLLFFFVPETAFVRDPSLNLDFEGTSTSRQAAASSVEETGPTTSGAAEFYASDGAEKAVVATNAAEAQQAAAGSELYTKTEQGSSRSAGSSDVDQSQQQQQQQQRAAHTVLGGTIPPKKPYWRTLLPFDGRKTNESFWKLFFRPIFLFVQPGILWACLTQGTMIGWTVFIGVVLAAILFFPPLFFSELQTGYMYTSAFLGAIIAFILCGLIADPAARFLTRRNRGTFEPEFRLVLVIPQWVFAAIGLYGFGFATGDLYKFGWIGPEVFFGFVVGGMVCGAAASALYLVDAHRELAIECFTCIIIFKNIFSFALTFKGYDWVSTLKPRAAFTIIGSVQMGLCALSIFMYIFGKYNRWFWSKHDLLGYLGLR